MLFLEVKEIELYILYVRHSKINSIRFTKKTFSFSLTLTYFSIYILLPFSYFCTILCRYINKKIIISIANVRGRTNETGKGCINR